MIDLFKSLILDQYEATICTLHKCIEACPDAAWNLPVANHTFCQVVFHTFFFMDLYLGKNVEALRNQPFHKENPDFFRNYEEMIDKKPELLYDKPTINRYLDHCRQKAVEVVRAEMEGSLTKRTGFEWLDFSRAELHVYNIRHIHHHAAQLSLRLRLDFDTDIPWCKSGWRA